MGSRKGKHCRCRSAETLMLWQRQVRAASHEGGGEGKGNHVNIVKGVELDMPVASLSLIVTFLIQWNPVNTDTNGTCPSVRINGVSVLSGLSEKTLQTHVLSKKRP